VLAPLSFEKGIRMDYFFRFGAGGGGIKIIVCFYDLIGIRMGASMLLWTL
jgi:hypothetical protein